MIENVRISIETERALIESVRNSIGGVQVFNLKVENPRVGFDLQVGMSKFVQHTNHLPEKKLDKL